MAGLVIPGIQDNRRLRAVGHELLPATLGASLGAAAEQAITFFPGPSIARILELSQEGARERVAEREAERALTAGLDSQQRMQRTVQGLFADDDFDPPVTAEPPGLSPLLSAAEAQDQFGVGNLKFEGPVRARTARILARRKIEEIRRQDIIRRAPQGIGPTGARLGVALAVSFLDPVNVAAAFIPIVSQARFAGMIARLGVKRARIAKGVIEGAGGNALVEPIVIAAATQEQADYTAADTLMNIAFGGVIGGGLHAVVGRVGDFLSARSAEAKEGALRAAVAQMASGRNVDVEPVFRADVTGDLPQDIQFTRTAFPPDFPKAVVQTNLQKLTRHRDFKAAKAGDLKAAKRLVIDLTAGKDFKGLRQVIGERKPVFVPVERLAEGNAIPIEFAKFLARKLGGTTDRSITLRSKRGRRNATIFERLGRQPEFSGAVRAENVILVDDQITQGGTLAGLRGRVELSGGRVIGVATLTASRSSTQFSILPGTVRLLRSKAGPETEAFFIQRFGFNFEALTESEARALLRSPENALAAAVVDARQNNLDIQDLAAREAAPERESAPDFEAADGADTALAEARSEIDLEAATLDADDQAAAITTEISAGRLGAAAAKALDETAELAARAKSYGKGARAAALCLARRA